MVMYNGVDYSQEQVQAAARRAGYQGEFGGGKAEAGLKASGQWDSYLKELQAPSSTITTQKANTINNPQLPTGGELVPELQKVNDNELLDASKYTVNPTGTQVQQPGQVTNPTITAQQGQATTVDPNSVNVQPAATVDPTLIGNNTPQATAQQGQVSKLSTVVGQLDKLYADLGAGQVPTWARGAVNAAEEMLAARGLGSSSIGGSAILGAVQQSALNIAAADASTYFQMDMANLNNRQQTELVNTQLRQQSLLSDQAAMNAAKQFNASSINQVNQFQAQLIAQIKSQNADRLTAMSQFNAGQANQVAAQNASNSIQVQSFNTQMKNSVDTFNAQLQNQREQFNSQMRSTIDQSNVVWRRNVNTANTAAINAANQTNVQNLFNMSQQAMNDLWQAWRDEANWAFTAAENQKQRDFSLVASANDRAYNSSLYDQAQSDQLYSILGSFAANLFN